MTAAPLVVAADGSVRMPLSHPQTRLWLLHRLNPEASAYAISSTLRLRGDLDLQGLRVAVAAIVDRHETLRTAFRVHDGEPVQVILPAVPVRMTVVDLGAEPEPDQRAHELCWSTARAPFNLEQPPLLRLLLLRFGPSDHLLLVCMHHIVADGWSLALFARELSVLYRASCPDELPELPVRYGDFTVWQREWLDGEQRAGQLEHWRRHLADLPAPLDLPFDRPRPPVRAGAGATLRFVVDSATTAAARTVAAARQATLSMVLLAAYEALLATVTGRHEFLVGTVVANRVRPELEQLIGFFVNTVALRADLRGQPTFGDLVDRVRAEQLTAFDNQDVPFDMVVDHLGAAGATGRNPLFDVLFVMENAPQPTFSLHGLEVSPQPFDRADAKFDLTLFATEAGDRLDCALEYDTALFDGDTVTVFARRYPALLAAACTAVHQPVLAHDLTTEPERKAVLRWRAGPTAPPAGTITDLVTAQCARTPDAVAVEGPTGDRLTYAALHDRARTVAGHLAERGIGRGDLVAVQLAHGPDLVAVLLGVLLAGAAYVPLDPGFPAGYRAELCADCHPRLLVVAEPDPGGGNPETPQVRAGALLAGTPGPGPGNGPRPEDLAYVSYTSGSTGRPKGVMVPHAALTNVVRWLVAELALDTADRGLVKTSPSFDAVVRELFPPLACGARLVVAPHGAGGDPTLLAKAIRDRAVTVLHTVPTVLSAVLDEPDLDGAHTLRAVMCGGEELPRALALRFARRSAARLYNVYGPTEATVDATCHVVVADDDRPRVPIGRPIPGVTVDVLDDRGRPVPPGIPGTVHIGGIGVARGYLGDPALTARCFRADPAAPGARRYDTGDLARLTRDGCLEFLGRIDAAVKVGGVRVEPVQVESVLRGVPGVSDVAVAAHNGVLSAYAVLADGADPSSQESRTAVGAWRMMFDRVYEGHAHGPDADTNAVGWRLPGSRQQIPDDAMVAMVSETVTRLRRWQPRRVLEIGCGTGLLLLRMAPHCVRYTGLDFSAPALDYVRDRLRTAGLGHVDLHQVAADELHQAVTEPVDLVVLNSVVQYFPDEGYLLRVLDQAASVLAPGGSIVVGDLRDLRLRDLHDLGVEAGMAPADLHCAALRRRARARTEADEELLADPALIEDWAGHTALVEPRQAPPAELTAYRVDVTIRPGGFPTRPVPAYRYDGDPSGAGIVAALRRNPDGCLVTGVPNGRLAAAAALRDLLDRAARLGWTVAELRNRSREAVRADALDPAELCAALGRAGVRATLLVGADPTTLTVSGAAPGSVPVADPVAMLGGAARSSRPGRARRARAVRARVRQAALAGLPATMVPARIVIVSELPRLPSGKIDRPALLAADSHADRLDSVHVEPATRTEMELVALWRDQLGLDRIGVHDDFFRIGGHSLLGTRLVGRMQARFGVEIGLAELFDRPTVAQLAQLIETRRGLGTGSTPAGPVPGDRETTRSGPLSPAQERLWFVEQMRPGPAYTIAHAMRLSGEFDIAAFRNAVRAVIVRHPALRTRFPVVDGVPHQLVEPPPAQVDVPLVSVPGPPGGQREQAAVELAEQAADRPFDLAAGPLFRVLVLCLGPGEHLVVLTMHHIVADGWSMNLLVDDLATSYGAAVDGRPTALPDLELDYLDYARWQRARLGQPELDAQVRSWQARLGVRPPILRLPTDFARGPVGAAPGATVRFTLDAATTRSLERLGESVRCTLFMVLLAGWQVVLHELSGQDDFVIGTVTANRGSPAVEPLVGFFVNALPLRARLHGDPTFDELLGRVRDTVVHAQENQDLPFERLIDLLEVDRETTHQPVFQVLFAMQTTPLPEPAMPGLAARRVTLTGRAAMFDLSLEARRTASGLRYTLEYDAGLFEPGSVERLAQRYTHLLRNVVTDPATPLHLLDTVPPAQVREAVAAGIGPTLPPSDARLPDLVAAHATARPDATAVRRGAATLTYGELWAAATRLAETMRQLGIGPGDLVGLCLPRSPAIAVGLLATLARGAAFVPLDRDHPPQRLDALVRTSGLRVVIGDPADADAHRARGCAVIVPDGSTDRLPDRSGLVPETPVPAGTAYVTFTSGSSGAPKGVIVSAAAITSRIRANQAVLPPLTPTDRFLHCYSFNYDGGLMSLLWPLTAGATVVLAPLAELGDGAALARQIIAGSITVLDSIPAVLRGLFDDPASARCRTLRHVITGGEAVPAELAELVLQRVDVTFSNQYGPAEAVVNTTSYSCDRSTCDGRMSIGRALPDTRLLVLDPNGRVCPLGVPGELFIGGPHLASGYLADPDATAERFAPNPNGPGRWYRSGDRVRLRVDGNLEFLGRVDRQVQIRAMRVELAEVEAALATSPDVAHVAVAARPGPDGTSHLYAYVVPAEPDPGTADEARRERVGRWAAGFDRLYAAGAGDRYTGWDESLTGAPLPAADMRDWLAGTVDRIRATHPRDVVEVGFGLGAVLLEIAPQVSSYLGLDVSAVAVREVGSECGRRGWRHVRLHHGSALDLADAVTDPADLVILNSVVQYFPDSAYLRSALEAALGALRPGGCVFVGDLRPLALRGLFSLSLQLPLLPADAPLEEVRGAVTARSKADDELAVDPAFLRAVLGPGDTMQVSVKRGRAVNELTAFRYDVLIRTADGTAAPAVEWRHLPGADPDRVAHLLHTDRPAALLTGPLANRRVAHWAAAARLLESGPTRKVVDVAALRAAAGGCAGVDPEDLWQLGQRTGYAVNVRFADGDPYGAVTAAFVRADIAARCPGRLPEPPPAAGADSRPATGRGTSAPLLAERVRTLRARLRDHVAGQLPSHMVPEDVVVIDALPLRPGGKVDFAALPAPPSGSASSGEPADPLEATLADLEAELLEVDLVGRDADFFRLGGHSLLAAELMARVRATFGVELPVATVFQAPTVAGLAAELRRRLRADPQGGGSHAPTPAPGRHRHLSPAQREVWERARGGTAVQHIGLAARLVGPLDVAALAEAVADVVGRHDVLGLRVTGTAARPVVSTADPAAAADRVRRPRTIPARDDAFVDRLALEGAREPLDLAEIGPIDVGLTRLADRQHLLLVRLHPIAADGASVRIVLRELADAYSALVTGTGAAPRPDRPPVAYRDLAYAEQLRAAGPEGAADLRRWCELLAGHAPAGAPDPGTDGGKQLSEEELHCLVPKAAVRRLRAAARRAGTTAAAGLIGAFTVALTGLYGRDRALVGIASDNRWSMERATVVGPLATDLPLATATHPEGGAAILRDTGSALRALLALAPVPMRVLRDTLGWPAGPTAPSFDAVVALREQPLTPPPLAGLRVIPAIAQAVVPPLSAPVRLSAMPTPGGLRCTFRTRQGAAHREQLLARFRAALDDIMEVHP